MKMDIFYKDKMPELHLEWEVVKGKTLVKEDFSMSELWLFLTSENGMRWISANIEDNVIKADVPNVLSAGEYGFKVIWVKDGTGSKSLNELLACSKRCVSEVSSVFGVTDSKKSDINPSTNVTFKIRSAVATYGYDGLSAYERAVMLNITRESENVWLRTHATIEPGEGVNAVQQVGTNAKALGAADFAEGDGTTARGGVSHAEGKNTTARGQCAHSEGLLTNASGAASHAEGVFNAASGLGSHVGGHFSAANGEDSFVHGKNLVANNVCEVAFGKFNESHTNVSNTQEGATVFSIGCGEDSTHRKNALEVMQDGSIYIWFSPAQGTPTRYKLQDLLATLIEMNTNAGVHEWTGDTENGIATGSGASQEWTPLGDDVEAGEEEQQQVTNTMWYVGQISKSKSEFAELTAEQLVAASEAYPTTIKEANFRINHSCWFVMVPTGEDIQSASYTAGGFQSNFTEEDIKEGFGGDDVGHADVVIGGTTYKVYVNRNYSLTGSNAAGVFTLK